MDKPVIIFGAGSLGRLALEIFQSNGNIVYGFLDENPGELESELDSVPVLGSSDDQGFLKLIGKKCEACVAVEDLSLHRGTVAMLNEQRKMMPVNAIHQQAFISQSASFGHGNLISAGVVINANVDLGNHNIVHAHATIDYGVKIGNYLQLGAGATISADVEIGDDVFVGSGVVIIPGVKSGKGARIGAGSVVISDIAENATVFGNPATQVKND